MIPSKTLRGVEMVTSASPSVLLTVAGEAVPSIRITPSGPRSILTFEVISKPPLTLSRIAFVASSSVMDPFPRYAVFLGCRFAIAVILARGFRAIHAQLTSIGVRAGSLALLPGLI